jgi:uncharacterized protein (TIGR03086 family)
VRGIDERLVGNLVDAPEVGDTSAMEAVQALQAANEAFESTLRKVTTGQWDLPTPCPEWNARALVNHVLLGTRMSVHVLSGMPRDQVISYLDDDLMTDATDPVASFLGLADQMVAGFSGPDGLDGMVEHPGGDFPRSMFCGFRVADGACHAWDLARAIGADEALDADLLQFLWDDAQPQREMLAATGMFGDSASGTVGEDAPLQTRYLDLMGRRP